MYSVKELKRDFDRKISNLGLSSKFVNSPAFDVVLEDFDNVSLPMNMGNESETTTVYADKNSISYEWISPIGYKYTMSYYHLGPNSIGCTFIEDRKDAFSGTKNIIEKAATISDNGYVSIITYGGSAYSFDQEYNRSYITSWAEKKDYSPNAVMMSREHMLFRNKTLDEYYSHVSKGDILCRDSFNYYGISTYESRTVMVREKLDTARVSHVDRLRGINYNATLPLNQEHGLRDIILKGGESFPEEVLITPLFDSQIYEIISRESNPYVKAGLLEYAKGRDSYCYSSKNDTSFRREGIKKLVLH